VVVLVHFDVDVCSLVQKA